MVRVSGTEKGVDRCSRRKGAIEVTTRKRWNEMDRERREERAG